AGARNRATSSFAAMSSLGESGGDSAATPTIRSSAPRPAPANAGGNGGGGAAATKPLKLPELSSERAPDA
ncbi:MAG TPA: hypothetical protein VGR68_09370, partial [Actinomycetota bacterium]|nr:hypothetical protein [Actinomycetota bacterium]